MDGLWLVWTKNLYVFNGTKHVVQVDLGDLTPVYGLDIGIGSFFPITMKTSMITLSYYTDAHDLMSVVAHDNGSWTTSLTPMIQPSCYTKDRLMTMGTCIRRRAWCGWDDKIKSKINRE
jgi:hypothetical protein